MVAKMVCYEGRVQGVGFRYTVRQIATGFEVAGWVRNMDDGRVELLAAGGSDEVEAFLREIRESVLGGHIQRDVVENIPAPDGLRGFEIRF